MAYQFQVTVKGAKQGTFKGDGLKDKDKIVGLGFSDSVTVSQAGGASGAGAGKRQYGPIVFTKAWSASSPQFLQALVTNEVLTQVLFEFIKPTAAGVEQIYYTVTLTNATMVGMQQLAGNLNSFIASGPEIEEISLTFQKITVTDVDGSTSASDDWSVRV